MSRRSITRSTNRGNGDLGQHIKLESADSLPETSDPKPAEAVVVVASEEGDEAATKGADHEEASEKSEEDSETKEKVDAREESEEEKPEVEVVVA